MSFKHEKYECECEENKARSQFFLQIPMIVCKESVVRVSQHFQVAKPHASLSLTNCFKVLRKGLGKGVLQKY